MLILKKKSSEMKVRDKAKKKTRTVDLGRGGRMEVREQGTEKFDSFHYITFKMQIAYNNAESIMSIITLSS